MDKHNHVIWHQGEILREDINRLNNHKSGLVWFTGLSGSGKSSIAHGIQKKLYCMGIRSYVLDGDNIRHGLNKDIGFSPEDRRENLRRIVELSRLFVDAGIIVLAAFISPHKNDREYVRERFKDDNFLEIYVKCSIQEYERRDPKEQYKKARAGIIKNYTGISSPYDEPEHPDLIINTEEMSISESLQKVLELFETRDFLLLR